MDELNPISTKVYITGTSRGLGKAIAEEFLNNGFSIIGISRSCSIEHLNYSHKYLDLSKIDELRQFEYSIIDSIENIILINNAGTLGEVKPFSSLKEETILQSIQLNYTAPLILINKLYNATCNQKAMKLVLNIGTGAANRAMDGWSLYCSSKAALQMFDEVISIENKMHNKRFENRNLKPGVVDTEMQNQIRESEERNFSSKQVFIDYFENNDLQAAQHIARLIFRNFIKLFEKKETVISINDIKN